MKLILILAVALGAVAQAKVVDTNQLNAILKAQNAGWTAKTNTLNEMDVADFKRMLGVPGQQDEAVLFEMPKSEKVSGFPARLDWRNNNGNWVSPILDQGNCGSCVAFASVAVLETQYKIASGFAGFNIKLSPQHLFSCGGAFCDFGWYPDSAAKFIQTKGVPDESCMPYIAGATGQDVACSATCADAPRRAVKIQNFSSPTRRALDLDALRTALQKGPLMTTLGVYADFVAYSGGVYKHVTGARLGGHAISIVGYDDNLRALIIRNSWGKGWGEDGFGYVSYDDVSGVGTATWAFDMPSLNGGVSVENPVDYTYSSGTMPLKVTSTFPGTDLLTVSFFDAKGTAVWSETCSRSVCDHPVNVATLADGRYEVQAVAQDSTGRTLSTSTRQAFFVANAKPTLSLAFTGAKGTDLNKALKGRMEVAISAQSSSVPMNEIEFHYKGADGVDHSRTAAVVVDGMTMGWRTDLVPNGAYEIWLVGRVKTNAMETAFSTQHLAVTVMN